MQPASGSKVSARGASLNGSRRVKSSVRRSSSWPGPNLRLAPKIEAAKADKLAELRATGDLREVKFDVVLVVTGVVRPGETADPASAPSAPTFSSREGAPIRPPMMSALPTSPPSPEVVEESRPGKSRSPRSSRRTSVFKPQRATLTMIPARSRRAGLSIEGKVLTVTDANGRHVGSRAMLEGENPRVVAKRLLREKTPESESFSRPLSYPNAGLA